MYATMAASTSTLSCGKGGVGGELTLTTFYDWTIVGKGWRGGWKETSIFRTSKTDKNGKSYWTTLSNRTVQVRKRNKGENETEKRKMRKELHLGSRFVRSMNVLRTWESFEETTTRREKFTKGRWSCSNYGHLAGFSLKKGLSENELESERESKWERMRVRECVCLHSLFLFHDSAWVIFFLCKSVLSRYICLFLSFFLSLFLSLSLSLCLKLCT